MTFAEIAAEARELIDGSQPEPGTAPVHERVLLNEAFRLIAAMADELDVMTGVH